LCNLNVLLSCKGEDKSAVFVNGMGDWYKTPLFDKRGPFVISSEVAAGPRNGHPEYLILSEQERQFIYTVTLRRVRVTIIAVEKQ
jgi:hypothetical protein